MKDFDLVRAWILAWLERELGVPAKDIETDKNLLNYGIDSVNAIMLVGDLENHLNLRLPPTLLWDHPTVDALTKVVVGDTFPASDSWQAGDRQDVKIPGSAALSQQEAEELLANIDQLSDDQINELLSRLTGE